MYYFVLYINSIGSSSKMGFLRQTTPNLREYLSPINLIPLVIKIVSWFTITILEFGVLGLIAFSGVGERMQR